MLFWAQHRAKKENLVYRDSLAGGTFLQKAWSFVIEADLVGMLFLGATITLIFLPLVLAGGSYASKYAYVRKACSVSLTDYIATTWQDPSIPAMMVVGGVVALPAFVYWELKRAKFPIVPFRLLRNRTVLSACIVNFFDFVSFYLTVSLLVKDMEYG